VIRSVVRRPKTRLLLPLLAAATLALSACAPRGHPYLELSAFEICRSTCADHEGLSQLDFAWDHCVCSDGSRFQNGYCEPGLLSCVPYFDSEDELARDMEWLLDADEPRTGSRPAEVGAGPD